MYTDAAGEAQLRDAFSEVSSGVVEPGWEDGWKEFHRPVRAGGLWIGPPWIDPPAAEIAVVVDPGRAFGTGAHPTTRACIELLAGLDRGSVLDAGCGSGVVSVAAARLGFAPVHAVDLDEVAVEVATATALANGVDVQVSRADVLADELPVTDLVVANIELAVVELLLQRVLSPRCPDVRLLRVRDARCARLDPRQPRGARRVGGRRAAGQVTRCHKACAAGH